MSRRTRTLVPVTTNLLYPKVVDGVQESLQLRRQKAKSYFAKNAKTLPELDIGQDVRVAGQRKKTGPTWFKLTEKQSAGTEKTSDHGWMQTRSPAPHQV